jgi:soluble lytic murein transglycosylase
MTGKTFLRAALFAALLSSGPALADTAQAMRTALDVASGRDWDGALAVAPAGPGRDVIEWQRLRAGDGRLGEYEDFLARNPDWPGLALLREKGEEAVARSDDPARVIAWFKAGPPKTGTGAIALVRALLALDRVAEAETTAMEAWSRLTFSAEEEAALVALKPDALELVHELRLDTLLWEGRRAEALRIIPRVGATCRRWQRRGLPFRVRRRAFPP